MEKVTLLAIDIAKEIFQLHGLDDKGNVILKKKLRRKELLKFIANTPICTIAMEACGGSHYWAREFKKLEHEVKLVSPQFVKPFVKGNKTDVNDAEAIATAASQPNMRFVPINSESEQDIQSIHRKRTRLITDRTALSNQVRGLLYEYGVFLSKGISQIKKFLVDVASDDKNENGLTSMIKELCAEYYEELTDIDERIEKCNRKLEAIANTNPICQKLMTVPGIGILGATILLTVLSDPLLFKNGRHFAAFIGLVPKQYSSGGKYRLYGISKRGDAYIRSLLVHGARSVLQVSHRRKDKHSQWMNQLNERRGHNRTCVAVANKNARIVWSLAKYATEYKKVA